MITKGYFQGCNTESDIKQTYRNLCKLYHPDRGIHDPEKAKIAMQEINAERDKALRAIYRASGLTDKQIDKKVSEFVSEVLENGSFSKGGVNEISEILGKEFDDQFEGKDPSFGEVFSFVSKKLFGAAKKIGGQDPGAPGRIDAGAGKKPK